MPKYSAFLAKQKQTTRKAFAKRAELAAHVASARAAYDAGERRGPPEHPEDVPAKPRDPYRSTGSGTERIHVGNDEKGRKIEKTVSMSYDERGDKYTVTHHTFREGKQHGPLRAQDYKTEVEADAAYSKAQKELREKAIQTGARGGRYYLSDSGEKVYVK